VVGTGEGKVWDCAAAAAECRREDVLNERVSDETVARNLHHASAQA